MRRLRGCDAERDESGAGRRKGRSEMTTFFMWMWILLALFSLFLCGIYMGEGKADRQALAQFIGFAGAALMALSNWIRR